MHLCVTCCILCIFWASMGKCFGWACLPRKQPGLFHGTFITLPNVYIRTSIFKKTYFSPMTSREKRVISIKYSLYALHCSKYFAFQMNGCFQKVSLRRFSWMGASSMQPLKIQPAVIWPHQRSPLLNVSTMKRVITTWIRRRYSHFHQDLAQLLMGSPQIHHQNTVFSLWIWSRTVTVSRGKPKLTITFKELTAVKR